MRRRRFTAAASTDQTIGTYGIPMTLIDNMGKSRINLPDGTVQEYDMKYSSLPAELAYGGFTVNAIPKVGGNLFTGTTFISSTSGAFQSSNLDDKLRAQGLTAEGKVKKMVDFNPVVGGPIVKDKIWFFGGAAVSVHRQLHRRHVLRQGSDRFRVTSPISAGPPTPISSATTKRQYHVADVQKNRLNVLLMRNVRTGTTRVSPARRRPKGGRIGTRRATWQLGKWTSTVTNRLLFDVTVSRYFHDFVRNPTNTAARSQIIDQGSGITFGGLPTSSYTGQLVYSARASAVLHHRLATTSSSGRNGPRRSSRTST